MKIVWENNKLILKTKNIKLVNYPLTWIDGLKHLDVDNISNLLFGEQYGSLNYYDFISQDNTNSTKKVYVFKKRTYVNPHVNEHGKIVGVADTSSKFWRGIYDPDLGPYGRLGGAKSNKVGPGYHERCSVVRDKNGNIKKIYYAQNTINYLKEASVNLVFPWTILVPPPQITLDYLSQHGIKAIFSLSGPKGGQPLSNNILGIGETSTLGSVWYNHPSSYENDRYAPGEKFSLLSQIELANKSSAVIAVLQQDEPFITSIYEKRFKLLKQLSSKPVFCTYNWGSFYNNNSASYRAVRNQRLEAAMAVTDIYSTDPYILAGCSDCFRDFGDPLSNTWQLVDRHLGEMDTIQHNGGDIENKPVWFTLQGYGLENNHDTKKPIVPDPDFMFAQIWTAVCLGATGVSIYLQHNTSADVSNIINHMYNENYVNIEGIAPTGPNKETWLAMAHAFKLIENFESILLTDSIEVGLCNNKHIITLIKEYKNKYYIFAQNTYRRAETATFDFNIFPGSVWFYKILKGPRYEGKTQNVITRIFSPFQLQIIEVQRVA